MPTGQLRPSEALVPAREAPFEIGFSREWAIEAGASDVVSLVESGSGDTRHLYVALREGQLLHTLFDTRSLRNHSFGEIRVCVSIVVRAKPKMRVVANRDFVFRFNPTTDRFEIRDAEP